MNTETIQIEGAWMTGSRPDPQTAFYRPASPEEIARALGQQDHQQGATQSTTQERKHKGR